MKNHVPCKLYIFTDDKEFSNRDITMLGDYLWTELDELDISDMWFQKDGATSHKARVTIDLLKGKFG